jgi:uncharacterized protein (DUF1330 family)
MAAYIIVDVTVHNAPDYEVYKQMTPDSLLPYGGRFVVRGGATQTLEGNWQPGRIVVLEFPTKELAKQWWSSSEYSPAKEIRQRTATTQMLLVEGFE